VTHPDLPPSAAWRHRDAREGFECVFLAAQVAGVLDVDLEASACTNTFPVHRLGLAPGAAAEAPAAYVRAPGLAVERLEQTYRRVEDGPDGPAFDYESPAFGTSCRLAFDEALLVVDYPDLAVRVA
jgi:uncharacterized protein